MIIQEPITAFQTVKCAFSLHSIYCCFK